MIVYSSPGTGKSTFCKKNNWKDGDHILADIISSKFGIPRTDINTDGNDFAKFLLGLFKTNRSLIEDCYTAYMNYLKRNGKSILIMIGTRRFMWLANEVYLETDPEVMKARGKDVYIIANETEFAQRKGIKYTELKGRYIDEVIIHQK